jgi:phenylacetate-CoA ligase
MVMSELEAKSREEIQRFQEQELQKLLVYLNQHSKFYADLFKKHKIDISKIKLLSDLSHIPVTTKEDLQARGNDFICVSRDKIIDYMTTSGTLGEPVTFVLTEKDLDRLAYNEYLGFRCAGCTSQEIFQLMTTIDRRFMAGLAYFLGSRRLGSAMVRVGNGIPELQWDTIKRISPTAYSSTFIFA